MTSRPNTQGQLELDLAGEGATGGRASSAERACPICGAALAGHRRDALYCGGPCRAEASRVRRLRDGQVVDGYPGLKAYDARQRRTQREGVAS
jgi:hypothetical protein